MASTSKEKKASKKYYDTHPSYRKKKIKETQRKQKSNRQEYNKDKREYYATHTEYRNYKRKYAKQYRKNEPIKSKAYKYRKNK